MINNIPDYLKDQEEYENEEEMIDPEDLEILEDDYTPLYEPSPQELKEHAEILGIEIHKHPESINFVYSALKSKLPENWKKAVIKKTGELLFINMIDQTLHNLSPFDEEAQLKYKALLEKPKPKIESGGKPKNLPPLLEPINKKKSHSKNKNQELDFLYQDDVNKIKEEVSQTLKNNLSFGNMAIGSDNNKNVKSNVNNSNINSFHSKKMNFEDELLKETTQIENLINNNNINAKKNNNNDINQLQQSQQITNNKSNNNYLKNNPQSRQNNISQQNQLSNQQLTQNNTQSSSSTKQPAPINQNMNQNINHHTISSSNTIVNNNGNINNTNNIKTPSPNSDDLRSTSKASNILPKNRKNKENIVAKKSKYQDIKMQELEAHKEQLKKKKEETELLEKEKSIRRIETFKKGILSSEKNFRNIQETKFEDYKSNQEARLQDKLILSISTLKEELNKEQLKELNILRLEIIRKMEIKANIEKEIESVSNSMKQESYSNNSKINKALIEYKLFYEDKIKLDKNNLKSNYNKKFEDLEKEEENIFNKEKEDTLKKYEMEKEFIIKSKYSNISRMLEELKESFFLNFEYEKKEIEEQIKNGFDQKLRKFRIDVEKEIVLKEEMLEKELEEISNKKIDDNVLEEIAEGNFGYGNEESYNNNTNVHRTNVNSGDIDGSRGNFDITAVNISNNKDNNNKNNKDINDNNDNNNVINNAGNIIGSSNNSIINSRNEKNFYGQINTHTNKINESNLLTQTQNNVNITGYIYSQKESILSKYKKIVLSKEVRIKERINEFINNIENNKSIIVQSYEDIFSNIYYSIYNSNSNENNEIYENNKINDNENNEVILEDVNENKNLNNNNSNNNDTSKKDILNDNNNSVIDYNQILLNINHLINSSNEEMFFRFRKSELLLKDIEKELGTKLSKYSNTSQILKHIIKAFTCEMLKINYLNNDNGINESNSNFNNNNKSIALFENCYKEIVRLLMENDLVNLNSNNNNLTSYSNNNISQYVGNDNNNISYYNNDINNHNFVFVLFSNVGLLSPNNLINIYNEYKENVQLKKNFKEKYNSNDENLINRNNIINNNNSFNNNRSQGNEFNSNKLLFNSFISNKLKKEYNRLNQTSSNQLFYNSSNNNYSNICNNNNNSNSYSNISYIQKQNLLEKSLKINSLFRNNDANNYIYNTSNIKDTQNYYTLHFHNLLSKITNNKQLCTSLTNSQSTTLQQIIKFLEKENFILEKEQINNLKEQQQLESISKDFIKNSLKNYNSITNGQSFHYNKSQIFDSVGLVETKISKLKDKESKMFSFKDRLKNLESELDFFISGIVSMRGEFENDDVFSTAVDVKLSALTKKIETFISENDCYEGCISKENLKELFNNCNNCINNKNVKEEKDYSTGIGISNSGNANLINKSFEGSFNKNSRNNYNQFQNNTLSKCDSLINQGSIVNNNNNSTFKNIKENKISNSGNDYTNNICSLKNIANISSLSKEDNYYG